MPTHEAGIQVKLNIGKPHTSHAQGGGSNQGRYKKLMQQAHRGCRIVDALRRLWRESEDAHMEGATALHTAQLLSRNSFRV
jgi:hypothetical protein